MVTVQALNPLIAMALERRFGAGIGVIGHVLGIVTLLTTIGCLPVAGFLDRLLQRRFGPAARPVIMGISACAAIPCAMALMTVGMSTARCWRWRPSCS